MSTKFYIKDDNGTFLSIDGKTRFSCLEGQALLHSAAHSGRWCGGPAAAVRFKQRPKLVSYIRFNHHGVVLCCPL